MRKAAEAGVRRNRGKSAARTTDGGCDVQSQIALAPRGLPIYLNCRGFWVVEIGNLHETTPRVSSAKARPKPYLRLALGWDFRKADFQDNDRPYWCWTGLRAASEGCFRMPSLHAPSFSYQLSLTSLLPPYHVACYTRDTCSEV